LLLILTGIALAVAGCVCRSPRATFAPRATS
jgi:hypothetical protein